MSGWIKLHRKMIDWEWYDDTNTFRLFIHCLLRANHRDKKWRGIEIKRGQFYTSLDTLSDETGLSARQIRTSLDRLKMTGELSSTAMRRGRMITVVKYESYQEDDRQTTAEMSVKCQSNDRLATANKNVNNIKNINIPSTLSGGAQDEKPQFSETDMKFAEWMLKIIREKIGNFKQPNLKSWAKTIRLMREQDNRDYREMSDTWLWCRDDEFWSTNVLSADKFRKQYDTLFAKSQTQPNGAIQ